MTYQEKIKASKPLLDAIFALKDNEYVTVTYGTDYNNEPKRFRIKCSVFKFSGPSYSIFKDDFFSTDGMNFDSFSKTTAKAYTYDMMGQRTNYTFPLYKMVMVNETVNAE